MGERFEWVNDSSRGEWLRAVESEPWGSLCSIVPGGFPAYARVFHPAERDRPHATGTWHGVNEATLHNHADQFDSLLETQRTSWEHVAASFGTTMHAEAQYARLVRRNPGRTDGVVAPDGWRYNDPLEGSLDIASLSLTAGVLGRHTTTPKNGIAAIWEGWGGLLTSSGFSSWGFGAKGSSIRNFFGQGRKGSGILPRDIAAGPRFGLHADAGRSYILFEAGACDFIDKQWPSVAPWAHNGSWDQTPSLLWPDDHAWVLATEIDHNFTLIAGSTAMVSELKQTPGLEVHAIDSGSNLTWDGDMVNDGFNTVERKTQ